MLEPEAARDVDLDVDAEPRASCCCTLLPCCVTDDLTARHARLRSCAHPLSSAWLRALPAH